VKKGKRRCELRAECLFLWCALTALHSCEAQQASNRRFSGLVYLMDSSIDGYQYEYPIDTYP
jgi:hypothetical protein